MSEPVNSLDNHNNIEQLEVPSVLGILPLRDVVLFPGMVMPLNIGRERSLKLIENSILDNRIFGALTQKDRDVENPGPDDFGDIGSFK